MLRFIFGIIFFTVILYSVILGSVSGFCELLNNWEGAHIKPKTIFRISIILLILSLVFFFWVTDGVPVSLPSKHFNLNPYNY